MTLDGLPPTYILRTNLQPQELRELEGRVPSLTRDINEAELVVGKITRKERALFELRRLKLSTEEFSEDSAHPDPQAKRRKVTQTTHSKVNNRPGMIKVLRLSWITDSLERGDILPVDDYLLYHGQKISPEAASPAPLSPSTSPATREILKRAIQEGAKLPEAHRKSHRVKTFDGESSKPPSLARESTSEHEKPLPPVPDFLSTTYSCQRPTPVDSPNAAFIDQLKQIRTLRLLQGDQVGVRAYSSSIAALAAYPHPLISSPGCGTKIAELYHQWREHGHLREVEDADTDERLSVLKLFYEIWGVGDHTAREFYKKGWRDLDDVVEYGWNSLSRVQQIGVKFYDELQLKIPRSEVEAIGDVILAHARKINDGFQSTIVGGYRRGKLQSGDVDVVLSHPDEARTMNLVETLVIALEKSGYITHTLTLSMRNSERGQTPLPWRGEGGRGSGFDTLDKAMVVWQDSKQTGAPHRRVDIIVSPWKTVGCAVLGWSGGTTFQRDLRRYCKKEKNLKFDSSGIRSREDGRWMDLESGTSPATSMEEAERRVFEALGLQYRAPEERCTG